MLRQLTHFEVTLLIPSQNCVVCICHIFEDAKKRFDILFDGFGFKGARGGAFELFVVMKWGFVLSYKSVLFHFFFYILGIFKFIFSYLIFGQSCFSENSSLLHATFPLFEENIHLFILVV